MPIKQVVTNVNAKGFPKLVQFTFTKSIALMYRNDGILMYTILASPTPNSIGLYGRWIENMVYTDYNEPLTLVNE